MTQRRQPGVRQGQRGQLGDHLVENAPAATVRAAVIAVAARSADRRARPPGRRASRSGRRWTEGVQPDRRPRAQSITSSMSSRTCGSDRRGPTGGPRSTPTVPARRPACRRSGRDRRPLGQQVARLGSRRASSASSDRRPPGRAPSGHRDRGERSARLVVSPRNGRQRRLGRQPQVVGGLQPEGLGGQGDVLVGLRGHPFDLREPEGEQVDLPGSALRLGPAAGPARPRLSGVRRRAAGNVLSVGPRALPAKRSSSCRCRSGAPGAPVRTGRGWPAVDR